VGAARTYRSTGADCFYGLGLTGRPMHSAIRFNPGRAHPSGRGFSLIELVAVMTLAAILAAVAVPAMTSTGSMRRQAGAHQVARDLRLARELGITTGRTAWVGFDVASQAYTLRLEPFGNPGRAQSVAWIDPATRRDFAQEFDVGERIGIRISAVSIGGGAWVGFDSTGRPRSHNESLLAATGSITLDGSVVISVEPGAGWIEVQP